MTRVGIVAQLYGEHVEKRPFSMFTKDRDEQIENQRWSIRSYLWGAQHVDRYGHWDGKV